MQNKPDLKNFSWKKSGLLPALGLLFIVFLAFGNSLQNEYALDDELVTALNSKVAKGWEGIPEILTTRYHENENAVFGYRPLTQIVFAMEHEFFGMNPAVSHFINLILYFLCALVIILLLKELFPSLPRWLMYLVAALFLVHPAHSEVVNSLKNREEILVFLFSFSSLWLFSRFARRLKWYLLLFSFAGVFLALMTKENGITILGVFPFILIYGEQETGLYASVKQIVGRIQSFFSIRFWYQFAALLFILAFIPLFYDFWSVGERPFSYWNFLIFYSVIISLTQYFREDKKRANFNRRTYLFLALVLILYIVISKASFLYVIAVCAAFYVLLFWFRSRKQEALQSKISLKLGWVAGALVMLALVLIGYFSIWRVLPESNAEVLDWQLAANTGDYLIFFASIYFYLKFLVFPYPFRYYYGKDIIPYLQTYDFIVIAGVLILAVIIFFTYFRWRKHRALSFALLFFLITISIFSNYFFAVVGIVGERFLFMPSFGFVLALAVLLYAIGGGRQENGFKLKNKWFVIVFSGTLILASIFYNRTRNPDWKDLNTLIEADMPVLWESAKGNNLFAGLMKERLYTRLQTGQSLEKNVNLLNDCIKHYKQAIHIAPTYGTAWDHLGTVYLQIHHDTVKAENCFYYSIYADPDFPEAYRNMGYLKWVKGETEEAYFCLRYYSKLRPGNPESWALLAHVFDDLGKKDSAYLNFQRAFELDSLHPMSLRPLYELSKESKGMKAACRYGEIMAAQNFPEADIFIEIGNHYFLIGDTLKAIGKWEQSFEIDPTNKELGMNLAGYYSYIGDSKKVNYYMKQVQP